MTRIKIKTGVAAAVAATVLALPVSAGAAPKHDPQWSGGKTGYGWYLPELRRSMAQATSSPASWSGGRTGYGWYLPELQTVLGATR
jgi:hypothetical protein